MEEVPGPTIVVAAIEERERREVREGEMGLAVRRWRRIWTSFQSPTGRTLRRNKGADGDHGRGLEDNGEDGDGEDGRRSRGFGEEEIEREGRKLSSEAVAQVNEGRGERREGRWSASRIQPRQLRETGKDEENGDGAGDQRG